MKIKSIEIENFRCIERETIRFNDYTLIVGPNGGGKSTVLNALNVFFREAKAGATNLLSLSREDFHHGDVSKPIKISVTFGDLSEAAKQDLKDYVRQDQLVVSAIARCDDAGQIGVVTQHGSRLGMKQFASFFRMEGDGESVADLKIAYAKIREELSDLPPPGTKQAMINALSAYEAAHPESCALMLSKDEFYGITKGANRLGRYIQWIFIPAVKDASAEQAEAKDTALGKLIERTVRSKVQFTDKLKAIQQRARQDYDTVLTENQQALDSLSESLQRRLCEWAHPNAHLAVKWDKDPKKCVQVEEPFARIYAGDRNFLSEVTRLGHGLQRSYMFALLNELATGDSSDAPKLLLAIEEPELFQHPPQARHLADTLAKLSTQNAQVFACSHSPYFVTGDGFEDVRMIRPTPDGKARCTSLTFDQLAKRIHETLGDSSFKRPAGARAKINQSLQPVTREMFFAPKIALVEGLEDVAYFTAGLALTDRWDAWRASGCHLVPVDGKSELIQPLAMAQLLDIPCFVIFDADGDLEKKEHREKAQRDNERLSQLLGGVLAEPFPAHAVFAERAIAWPSNFGAAVQSDYSEEDWLKWKNKCIAELGHAAGLEKNSLFIAAMMEAAWADAKPSTTLTKACDALLTFARSS